MSITSRLMPPMPRRFAPTVILRLMGVHPLVAVIATGMAGMTVRQGPAQPGGRLSEIYSYKDTKKIKRTCP
jgi:hypothetical protein